MACGTPVAAYGRGGLTEIVTPAVGPAGDLPGRGGAGPGRRCCRHLRPRCGPPARRARPWPDADGRRVRGALPEHRGRGPRRDRLLRPPRRAGHLNRARAVALRAGGEDHRPLLTAGAGRLARARGCRLARDDDGLRGRRPDREREPALGTRAGRRPVPPDGRRSRRGSSPYAPGRPRQRRVGGGRAPGAAARRPGRVGRAARTARRPRPPQRLRRQQRPRRGVAAGGRRAWCTVSSRADRRSPAPRRRPLAAGDRQVRASGPRVVAASWSSSGRGGGHATAEAQVERPRPRRAGLVLAVLGGAGEWCDDPLPLPSTRPTVVVVQAGESAVADVAARRRPAVVVPASRPFDEQTATGRALAAGAWPCRVEERFPASGWSARLAAVAALDGQAWRRWCDGDAADRLADLPGVLLVAAAQEDRMTPTTAVVTIAHGRHRHLRRQHASLASGTLPGPLRGRRHGRPGAGVVDDGRRAPSPGGRGRRRTPEACRWQRPATWASGRLWSSAPTCWSAWTSTAWSAQPRSVPTATLVRERPDVLWSGPTTYLPATARDCDPTDLDALDDPHPARPSPARGTHWVGADPRPLLVPVVRGPRRWRGRPSAASARGTPGTAPRTPTSPTRGSTRVAPSAGSATPAPTTSTTPRRSPRCSTSTTSCATARSSPSVGAAGPWGLALRVRGSRARRPRRPTVAGSAAEQRSGPMTQTAHRRAAEVQDGVRWPPSRPTTSTCTTSRPRTPTGCERLPDPDPDDPRRSAQEAWWPPVMLDPDWIAAADFDVFHLQFGFDAWSPERLRDVVAALRRRHNPSSTPCTTCATPTTRTAACTTPSSTCSYPPPTPWSR